MNADFFLIPGKFHSLYAVEDDQGTVMYVRQEGQAHKMRVHIQFGGNSRRVLDALREGLPMVMQDAKGRGFKSLVFDSQSPALTRFMVSEFKFMAELEMAL